MFVNTKLSRIGYSLQTSLTYRGFVDDAPGIASRGWRPSAVEISFCKRRARPSRKRAFFTKNPLPFAHFLSNNFNCKILLSCVLFNYSSRSFPDPASRSAHPPELLDSVLRYHRRLASLQETGKARPRGGHLARKTIPSSRIFLLRLH